VFPRLFRGGQAHLSLSTGKDGAEIDILEAGVGTPSPGQEELDRRPAVGRREGADRGRAVFSIFLIGPSPFCILDEVDAPLDEANVDATTRSSRDDRPLQFIASAATSARWSADNLYGGHKRPASPLSELAKLGKQQAAA
jgi:chromosome segregation protein